MLDRLGTEEINRRCGIADRHLREAGVFYRVYGESGGTDRPWPLAHVPLILGEDEWAGVSRGMIQRAEILESILADIYGEGRLVSDGALPAAIVAGNPEYHRPLVGVRPKGGHFLHFYAADLGRGPDGTWWVLNDRTQAPSGAGYVVENRVAISRAVPELYQGINAERIAGFFQQFRDALAAMTGSGSARVGVLTPGPLNETYFEHAYLARYLGFLLLEGGDLVTRGGKLHVKTVAGLAPIDVLWRRIDTQFVDPLELNTASRLGVPGLVDVVRHGQASFVNALGSGILESRALMSFIPGLAKRLTGEDLILPNIATWWCGERPARDKVLAALDSMLVAPAMTSYAPRASEDAVFVADLDAAGRAEIAGRITGRGSELVGQEVVRLSTMPVWNGTQLEPRPFALRVFLARTGDGWQVMPGGFCRISDRSDTRAFTMQKGGRAADMCIRSSHPPKPVSLLPRKGTSFVRHSAGTLPSRAADSLFWLGRYSERAEMMTRILRAITILTSEAGEGGNPVRDELARYLGSYGIDEPSGIPAELVAVIERAFLSASSIRDRFAPDAWLILRDLLEYLRPQVGLSNSGMLALAPLTQTLRMLAALAGLAQENMYQTTGWRFLKCGQRLERGIGIARLADRMASEKAPVGSLDMLLEIADSVLTHRRRYAVALAHDSVFDLVVLDPQNPRSVAFQVNRMNEHVQSLPGYDRGGSPGALEREVARLAVDLATSDAAHIRRGFMPSVSRRLMGISEALTERYFTGISDAMTPLEMLA